MVRSDLLNKYGYGVFHKRKSKMELLMAIFKAKEYTLKDKFIKILKEDVLTI